MYRTRLIPETNRSLHDGLAPPLESLYSQQEVRAQDYRTGLWTVRAIFLYKKSCTHIAGSENRWLNCPTSIQKCYQESDRVFDFDSGFVTLDLLEQELNKDLAMELASETLAGDSVREPG